jgi:hypothetical protein
MKKRPNLSSHACKLQKRSETAHMIAADEARKIKSKNKETYDSKVKEVKLEIRERVLVRNVGLKGKNKLADKWNEEMYVLVNQRPGVYGERQSWRQNANSARKYAIVVLCFFFQKGQVKRIQKREGRKEQIVLDQPNF